MDSYVVARVQPIKKSALAGSTIHVDRTNPPLDTESHIDVSRTHLNQSYSQVPGATTSFAAITSVTKTLGHARKKDDPILAAEFILTAGAGYFDEHFKGWRDDSSILKPWSDAQIDFMRKTYKDDFVFAELHLDELAPHFHAYVVPTTLDRTGKKRVINYGYHFSDDRKTIAIARKNGSSSDDTKLGRLQTNYAQSMAHLNLKRGIRKSSKKHVTPGDYRKSLAAAKRLSVPAHLKLTKEDLAPVNKPGLFNAKSLLAESQMKWRKVLDSRNFYLTKANESLVIAQENAVLKKENDGLKMEIERARIAEDAAIKELKSNPLKIAEVRALNVPDVIKTLNMTDTEVDAYRSFQRNKKDNAIDLVMIGKSLSYDSATKLLLEHFDAKPIVAAAQIRSVEIMPRRVEKSLDDVIKSRITEQLDTLDADYYTISFAKKTTAGKEGFMLKKGKDDALVANPGLDSIVDDTHKFNAQDIASDKFLKFIKAMNAHDMNVYVTPYSSVKDYLLIDDLTPQKSIEIVKNGLEPCAIIKTSRSSLQAVLAVKKGHDDDTLRSYQKSLNDAMGDPGMSGIRHPVRLAGFVNRKEKHLENGSLPLATVQRARPGAICEQSEKALLEIQAKLEAAKAPKKAFMAASEALNRNLDDQVSQQKIIEHRASLEAEGRARRIADDEKRQQAPGMSR